MGSPYVEPVGPAARNVLLISMDTTRADRINSNGYTAAVTSPNIDALLAGGLALRNHRSCSAWTMPSFLCLLTGRDQVALGFWPDVEEEGGLVPYPTDDLPSLAWQLGQQGFATGLVTSNALIGPSYNMSRGHDTVVRTNPANETATEAVARLSALEASAERWFLHVHFMDPHKPYAPLPEFEVTGSSCPAEELRSRDGFHAFMRTYDTLEPEVRDACMVHLHALYDALILQADHYIQAVLDHLEALGARDETVIVFMTDHGEAFYEHGEWEHGHGLFDNLTRSTLGIVYPPRIPPAAHHGLTSHADVLPTLYEALDLAAPPGMTGGAVGQRPVERLFGLVYANTSTRQAVVTPSDKLIYHWDDTWFYHDLVADPEELDNRYDPADVRVQELWGWLEPKVRGLAELESEAQPVGLP